MSAIEREIIEKVKRLDEVRQERVLEFVESLESQPPETNLSARELMKLPFEERNRLVIAALERSADEDFEVFEANDADDFDDYTDP